VKFPKTQVLALVNQKGGCGKTSSTVGIGAAFAHLGYKTCIVDTDPQCNATESFGVRLEVFAKEGRFTLADAYLTKKSASDMLLDFGERFGGNLTVVPGNRGLSSVYPRLEADLQRMIANEEASPLDADDIRSEHRLRLRKSLDSLKSSFDVVLIDTPPNLDFLMTTALIAADWFIIPVFPSGYDLSGLETLTRTVEKVRARYNPALRLAGVLLGNYDRSASLDREIHGRLTKKFGEQLVFRTTIGRSVRHREATFMQKTIFEHPEGTPQAQQYLELVQEMISRGARGASVSPLPEVEALGRVANG
jgi:chromosome partitioning protein